MVPVGPHLLSLWPPASWLALQLPCHPRASPYPMSNTLNSQDCPVGWSGLASRTEPTINRGTAVSLFRSGSCRGVQLSRLVTTKLKLGRHHAKNGEKFETLETSSKQLELVARLLRVKVQLIRIYGNEEIKGFVREITKDSLQAA